MPNVLIIGGGIIGLACAFRLARRGHGVRLLERGTLGSGATLSSLGALWPSRPSIRGPQQDMQRQSLWMLADFFDEIQQTSDVPIAFARHGHVEIITSPKHAGDAQRDADRATDWPTYGHARALAYLPPGAAMPATEDGFGALRSHVTAQVDVPTLVASLAAACRKLGVEAHENCAVEALVIEQERLRVVRTAAGDFTPDAVVVATGAWTAQLHPLLATFAATRPVKGQAVEVEAQVDVPQLIIKREKTYLVPWGRRVLIGSTTEKTAGFDTTAPETTAAELLARAQRFCPALSGARIVRTWAGLRPDAPKHRAIMAAVPGAAGVYVCAGHYKTGIGLSALASLRMVELVEGT